VSLLAGTGPLLHVGLYSQGVGVSMGAYYWAISSSALLIANGVVSELAPQSQTVHRAAGRSRGVRMHENEGCALCVATSLTMVFENSCVFKCERGYVIRHARICAVVGEFAQSSEVGSLDLCAFKRSALQKKDLFVIILLHFSPIVRPLAICVCCYNGIDSFSFSFFVSRKNRRLHPILRRNAKWLF
jgi:hypothetical protein